VNAAHSKLPRYVRRVRIVVLDGYTLNPGDNPWDDVAALGELVVYDRTPAELVLERAGDAEIIATNKTPLPAAVLGRMAGLKLVTVLATGFDVVDCAAARRAGIAVANVPDYATESVAQHTLALLLALTSGVAEHDAAVHAGAWSRAEDFCFWNAPPRELAAMTMGIVGFGRIGRRVAELASAFGMAVIACGRDGEATSVEAPATGGVDLATMAGRADVMSLHCPLTAKTRGLVGRELLARVKPTAYLINTARGGLVDEVALALALADGRLAGAAVDVVSLEPIAADNPLLAAPRCIITPHMAWSSLAARRRIMETTAANIEAFLADRPVNLVT
jgi:glycerate dehydrogenase